MVVLDRMYKNTYEIIAEKYIHKRKQEKEERKTIWQTLNTS